jgi:ligand-binding sensor protein
MSASAVYDALVRSALAHELESAFMEATGLPMVLMPSGDPLMLFTFRGRENPFCSMMAQSTVSCIACQKAHMELQQRIVGNLVPQVTHCFAGLTRSTPPIPIMALAKLQ